MLVACGPFTADSDTSYKPWRALLQHIKVQKPDVLLLVRYTFRRPLIYLTYIYLQVGPFVDASHPKIKIGDLDISPTMLFRAHFIDPLRAFLTVSPSSIVLIVPSVRDLTSNHAAFPQPEFDADLFSFNPVRFCFYHGLCNYNSCRNLKRIHLLPNPTRFTINGISFGITSVDTLFHLRKEEYFKRGTEFSPLPAAADDLTERCNG